jgi:methionyl-tRNA formyltransferase
VDPDLAALCRKLGIAYARAPSLSNALAAEAMRLHQIDLLLNGGGGIFRKALLEAVKVGVLNPHMGRLPHYRGYNVMEWMVLAGEMPCSTLHFVDTGLDTGDILLHRPIRRDELPAEMTLQGIRDRMGPVHLELLVEGARRLSQGTLKRIAQTAEQGRQYFVMHSKLKAQAEARLRRGDVRAVVDPAIPSFP